MFQALMFLLLIHLERGDFLRCQIEFCVCASLTVASIAYSGMVTEVKLYKWTPRQSNHFTDLVTDCFRTSGFCPIKC